MLSKILEIQKVGRFERLEASRVVFTRVMLVFGENGWGKSTLADLFRSVTTGSGEIVAGRETLASVGAQKIRLLFDRTQAEYAFGAWSGHKPTIAVYDQCYINDNVYSGDAVSLDHLKRQYGIVIGATGVSKVREIDELSSQINQFEKSFKDAETTIKTAMQTLGLRIPVSDFVALTTDGDVEKLITEKTIEISVVEKSAEISRLSLTDLFDVPTDISAFREALTSSIDDVPGSAHQKLHAHITHHAAIIDDGEKGLSHEGWIEAGLRYQTSDDCAFCGQLLESRSLIDTYRVFFSQRYKALATDVRKRRATLNRYMAGDFRKQLSSKAKDNTARCLAWNTLTGIQPFELDQTKIDALANSMEKCAEQIDHFFEVKQEDLTECVVHAELDAAFRTWDRLRNTVVALNEEIDAHRGTLSAIREGSATKDLNALKADLDRLVARRLRATEPMKAAVAARADADLNKTRYTNLRTKVRAELTAHSKQVAEKLGKAINAYLHRLGAGFKIDYQSPNFRGSEPSASYHILINDVAVPPRSGADSIAQPSFRNTLSTGDKSVLALAFFLASLAADANIRETIVILDDPFTSLDEFRRTFTANEIRKLSMASKQVIILSHDKTFLRLLWERVDQQLITAVAIQTGAPGISTLTPFDITAATLPLHETERTKMLDFLDDTAGEPPEVRALLRKVLEHFYRRADPNSFSPHETLDGILRFIKNAPNDYPFKGAYDGLESVNFYTRNFHHAPVPGSPIEQTDIGELKTYCRIVRDLTRGYV